MNNDDVPHIVCVGGGYTTIYLYRELRRWIRRGRVRITVIDRNNYQCFHGLVPEMMAGKIQPGNVLSPARRLFKHANFRTAEVEHIDIEGREVTFSRALDGRQFKVRYDHLVLDAGSKENLDLFPGIAEHTMRLKAFQDILLVRHHLISMLELADIEEDPEERRRLLTFVVAGGNYAGVEVSSELAVFLPAVARRSYPDLPLEEIKIVLLHSGNHVLPELGTHFPKLQAYAEKALGELGHLEIRTETRLASATGEEAVLSDGQRIATRTIISCTGAKAAPIVEDLPFERDASGRLITDEFVRVKGQKNIWAGGDCAAVPLKKGGTCPPLAIWAMTAGRQIGKNLKAQMLGRPEKAYSFNGLGDACTLGRRRAAAHLKRVQLRGLVAYLAWRFFMVLYVPSFEKKVRVIFDWIVGPFVGRDLVNMNVHRQVNISPAIFEPGQDVVREGDIGQSLYIIKSGEVEVLKCGEDDGSEERVATLGPGERFGEVAVFQQVRRTATVRAKTRVEVLHVRREAAVALSESMSGVKEVLSGDAT